MSINPSMFIGHGSPMTAVEKGVFQTDIREYAKSIDKPNAIVVVSAHWEQNQPLQITASPKPGLIYDFYGFPDELYQLEYNVPGDPGLAKKIADSLSSRGFETHLNIERGLDHGAWIPLKLMFPKADIPVLQLSIPIPRAPINLYEIGKAMKHLRKEGVLLTGSGNLIHNLGYVMSQVRMGRIDSNNFPFTPVEEWARDVDDWIKMKLDQLEIKDLLNSQGKIKNFKSAAPTTEHFDPLYFILGTLMPEDALHHFHESIHAGSISMRCFALENSA
ncbi:MAG: dioxygenase family protein [Candidatus Hodarchaeales archaeon]|jgi:4,5-DOPA dioxygenase extradiol